MNDFCFKLLNKLNDTPLTSKEIKKLIGKGYQIAIDVLREKQLIYWATDGKYKIETQGKVALSDEIYRRNINKKNKQIAIAALLIGLISLIWQVLEKVLPLLKKLLQSNQ